MIKRLGVEVMNARSKNVAVAKETLEILKKKSYTTLSGKTVDISEALDKAVKGTILYHDRPTVMQHTCLAKVEVTNETTAKAGARLTAEGKDVVILNFASARNQGGGFLSGAIAQEEDLCRASGLYACLKSKPVFYNENILKDDTLYTDNVIYSPNVPFFRDEHGLFLEEPFMLSVISAPAPNVRAMENPDDDLLYKTIRGRAQKVLEIALKHGHKTIVLGAWGCGAFGNDPKVMADVFANLLKEIPVFEHICFAVYDTREPPVLYETFKEICGSVSPDGSFRTSSNQEV